MEADGVKLPTPRRKRRAPLSSPEPFPISTADGAWKSYVGNLVGGSVVVSWDQDIVSLNTMVYHIFTNLLLRHYY